MCVGLFIYTPRFGWEEEGTPIHKLSNCKKLKSMPRPFFPSTLSDWVNGGFTPGRIPYSGREHKSSYFSVWCDDGEKKQNIEHRKPLVAPYSMPCIQWT